MTKEELLAEEHICNGKCQDDITKNYVHCKTCTRLNDFLAGYKAGIADLEKENAELKSGCGMCYRKDKEQLTKAKELLKQWLSLFGFKVEKLSKDTEQFLNSEVEK